MGWLAGVVPTIRRVLSRFYARGRVGQIHFALCSPCKPKSSINLKKIHLKILLEILDALWQDELVRIGRNWFRLAQKWVKVVRRTGLS